MHILFLSLSLYDNHNFCISFVDWYIKSFLYCFQYSYHPSNFAIARVVALKFLLHFLYQFCRLVYKIFSVFFPIQLSPFQPFQELLLLNFCYIFCISFVDWSIKYFLYFSPYSYHPSNFAIARLQLLKSLQHFLYQFCRLVYKFFSLLLPVRFTTPKGCKR